MKRILFIHHSGLIGGAGVSLVNVICALANEYEVHACIPTDPEDIAKLLDKRYARKGCIHTYGRRIGAVTWYSGGDHWLSMRFWYRCLLIVKQWNMWNYIIDEINPDIVVVNSKILCWMSLLTSVKKRSSICFVRETMRGTRTHFLNRLIAKLLDQFSRVVFLSDYDLKREKLIRTKTAVIHNYVESSQFDLKLTRAEASRLLGISERAFHVLYVGGVSEMKGFDIAAQAVLLCGKDTELIVAGNTFEDAANAKDKSVKEYVAKTKRWLEKYDVDKQIHLVGKQKNMSACYAACDVLIFPMRSPHQSRPAFEAGYFGKPVIITDFESIREFVQNDYNGYRIITDAQSAADAIKKMKEQPEEKNRMGKNNFINTQEKHSKEVSFSQIKRIINQLQ